MYRVYLRQLLTISWNTVVKDGKPNLKLLRDIGYQHAKGQLDKILPVDGALQECFKQSVFQANEYDQVFFETIDYLNPLEFGFDECQGGLRPTLNSNRTTVNSIKPQVVLQEVDNTLKPDFNIFYICECAQGTCGDDEVYVLPEEECIMEITTQSREQL